VTEVFLRNVLQLLAAANVVPSSLILFTLTMEAIRSSETSVLARATRRHIPEHGILHIFIIINFQLQMDVYLVTVVPQ
jgi:hypothetical protein